MLPSPRSYAFWLAIFRIYMGAYWLEHGLGKLMGHPPFAAPGGFFEAFLKDGVTKTSGPYHDFLAGVVVPNLSIFGSLVEFGETATGALLLLGLFSRLGGLLGVFLALNYWMAKGLYTGLSPYTGIDILTAVASALNVVLPTGRFLGLDAFMGRRRRVVAPSVPPPQRMPPPTGPPPIVTPPPRMNPPPGAAG
jgi:uncharacterized membrane protein YphA (DoxX/SURF4 family)